MSTKAPYQQVTPPRWEHINRNTGFVPPPRFQQLRNQQLQQQQQHQHQHQHQQHPQHRHSYYHPQPPQPQPQVQVPLQNQLQFPSSDPSPSINNMAPIPAQSPQPRPPMPNHAQSHTRTSSFFSFRSNKQSIDSTAPLPMNLNVNNAGPSQPVQFSPPANQHQRGPPSLPQPQQSLPPPPPPPNPSSPQQSATMQRQQDVPATSLVPSTAAPSNPNPNPNPPPPAIPAQQPAPPPLHPEIRSVVQLTVAHAHKVYFSGPLIRRVERQPDGQKHSKDDCWNDVWAQLGGTTLSIWDMKQIQEASKQGREVPPTYVNITDAFVQVMGSVTTPATADTPSQRYTNILALNTAGSNLLLFSCPSTQALISWASALRLSAWEKSRLEEIYTAHLIRITLNRTYTYPCLSFMLETKAGLSQHEMYLPPLAVAHGGWVRVRIAGQTDWKHVWAVVSAGSEGTGRTQSNPPTPGIGDTPQPPPQVAPKKKRMSNLFSRDHSPTRTLPQKATVAFYASQKPKDKKKPLMTMRDVTQAFAVRSTLIKVEGSFGEEDMAAGLKGKEGWILVMPELEGGNGQAAEMLKWVVAFHDAFELYGRPETWTWDPRNPISLMFAYPVGSQKETLFLDREAAEKMDPREERTSAIRSCLLNYLQERMAGAERPTVAMVNSRPPLQQRSSTLSEVPPSLPPIGGLNGSEQQGQEQQEGVKLKPLQLPPLSFESTPAERGPLTPITERSSINTNGRTMSIDVPNILHPIPQSSTDDASGTSEKPRTPHNVFDSPPSNSPPPISSPSVIEASTSQQRSASSFRPDVNRAYSGNDAGIRPLSPVKGSGRAITDNSRATASPASSQRPLSPLSTHSRQQTQNFASSPDPANIELPLSPEPPRSPSIQIRQATGVTDTRPRSPPISVLSSPHSLSEETRSKTQDTISTQYTADRRSILTSPHSIADVEHRAQPFLLSDRASVLTSPHSPASSERRLPVGSSVGDRNSLLTSPHSPVDDEPRSQAFSLPSTSTTSPDMLGQTAPFSRAPPVENHNDFLNEAGALYYMQQSAPVKNAHVYPTPNISQSTDEDSDSSDNYGSKQNISEIDSRSLPPRRSTPMAFVDRSSQSSNPQQPITQAKPADRISSSPNSRHGLGRKPSGARAPTSRTYNSGGGSISSHQPLTEEEETQSDDGSMDSKHADAPQVGQNGYGGGVGSSETPQQYKSSFAPSKQAAERKAKAQAQQAAHQAAVHKPGRANGNRKSRVGGAWNESSEEEEEEEEDEEGESDGEPPLTRGQNTPSSGPGSSNASMRLSQTQGGEAQPHSHLRPPRNLPQIPGGRPMPEDQVSSRRLVSDQFSESGRRTYYDDGPQIRLQTDVPKPGAPRQSMWSQVLEPGRAPGTLPPTAGQQPSKPDTFVQLEPSETMTKAFTPQGLLSAGLHDKDERSAKRQEELARETGASLINVPNKPPPPQTGLLGAITAHERERKRDGGVGAALTEREREKRVAEERQRRFDEQQRQQMEQMQQTGSMYGAPYPGFNPMMANMMMGMNPMMMNPMMTGGGMTPMMTGGGMNPMLTGGGMAPMMTGQMGFGGMGGGMGGGMNGGMGGMGFNPHMFAAQQAAQAYQQAMMAFSVAGSQAGGDATGAGASPAGGMNGFDPRMSMMGMPMMGSPQMGGQMPLGMQMTGMSQFDPRFGGGTPGMNTPGMGGMGGPAATGTPTGSSLLPNFGGNGQNQLSSSRTSSPAARGSPLARAVDTPPEGGRRSRPESPKQ
ncbi:hypothetical protein BDQ17DRAFT_1324157 [Cyathus striatus]|nr:hypothetical protein BDQ17DRAFT_1324157 [Cyathus striatus]